jgi:hypothetical protein
VLLGSPPPRRDASNILRPAMGNKATSLATPSSNRRKSLSSFPGVACGNFISRGTYHGCFQSSRRMIDPCLAHPLDDDGRALVVE